MKRFIVVFGTVLLLNVVLWAGEKTNNWPAAFVEGESKWLALEDLEIAAREYIQRKDTEFNHEKVGASIWIYAKAGATNAVVLVSYGTEFGKPFWNVYFGRNGQPIRFETGLLSEAVQSVPTRKPKTEDLKSR